MKFFKLVKKNKKINILLSGGTSVEKYLNIFLKSNVNWNNIRFYLTDERLTINKKNQNFFFIKKIFINNKINPRIIINIKNIKDKKKYIKTKFHLAILGLGHQGHIASIFKDSRIYNKLTKIKSKPNIFITEKIGLPFFKRITVNISLILKCKVIILFIKNKERLIFLKKILKNRQFQYPIVNLVAHKKNNFYFFYKNKKILLDDIF
jgi:6-phosphogluconolactonase/glucosamine-6-phosphate isomerase/deaminase